MREDGLECSELRKPKKKRRARAGAGEEQEAMALQVCGESVSEVPRQTMTENRS